MCCNCEEQCSMCDMTKWSKTKMSCHRCRSTYNRHQERMSKNPKLKAWWKDLPQEERVQWFQRNKKLQMPGTKKQWDDMSFEETTGTKNHKTTKCMTDFLDWEGWLIRQTLLEHERAKATELWEEALSDKSVRKKHFGDRVLVAVFKGVRDTTGSSEVHEQAWKWRKLVEDNVDTETAKGFEAQGLKEGAAWVADHSRLAAGNVATTVEPVDVDDAMVRFAQVPQGPDLTLSGNVKRDVVLKMQQDTKAQEAEEQDDFLAEQCGRLRRETAAKVKGRPRKMRGQLLADMGAFVRDRKTYLADQEAKLHIMVTGAIEESIASLGGGALPEDVSAVAAEVKKELTTAQVKTKEATGELNKIEVGKLMERGQSLDDLNKITTENLKPTHKSHSDVTKSLAFFRKAVKKALKESRKGKSKSAAADEKTQATGMHLAMQRFLASCSGDTTFAFGMVSSAHMHCWPKAPSG